MNIYIAIAIMAITTYLIRAIPFVALRKKIKSKFIYSFFYYIPYAILSSIVFPSVFYATGNFYAGIIGCSIAILLSLINLPLVAVSILSFISVYLLNLVF